MTYRSRPLFEWTPDWQTRPDGRVEFTTREVAAGFGAELLYADQEATVRLWTVQVWLDGLAQIEAFDAFTAALHGRLVGFWFPAPQAAFAIAAGVSAQTCDIRGDGLTDWLAARSNVHVWLTCEGQSPRAAKVLSAVPNGDGTTRVTFDESVGVDASWQAWELAYVRLADDTEEGQWLGEQRQARTVPVVELPLEYAEVESGERPVFLYRLWLGTGADLVQWHWTSHALDLEVSGQAYLARRITHSALRFDLTGIRQGVQIETERAEESPFALLFPPYACLPVHVEIASAQLPDLDAPASLFQGVVTTVQADGKTLRAHCTALGGDTPSSVPSFIFSGRCQYRVFDAGTCGLIAAAWRNSGDITGQVDRALTLASPALAGTPANWFAEGWLSVGTGAQRETRLILSHSPAEDNTLVVTLNAPLRWNGIGATATLTPGCDGRWTTCRDKFTNTARYGGHRFALRNLALTAVETPQLEGGKK